MSVKSCSAQNAAEIAVRDLDSALCSHGCVKSTRCDGYASASATG